MSFTPPQPTQNSHPWRKPLLATEFIALAILVGSMALLGRSNTDAEPLNPAWLVIPALASLAVFISFIGLMYLRWVAAASPERQGRHRVIFALLALTLLGVWGYGIVNTWSGLGS
ncbi:hypothetical protein [Marinobacter mobilis]|uniref:Uncharacterized protein n=1 Tax=Marinobacter mobilis TaxID=488533 RepID=A0A1H2XT52_9GAMM|nr:hypothetical protein [Marinobacter mobilis]SDW95644.1 hypothetical protein SAMN04487960_105144 [Marinobacter mobilis]